VSLRHGGNDKSVSLCASGCEQDRRWWQIRQQILACEDLPMAARRVMIDLGDSLEIGEFASESQTAR